MLIFLWIPSTRENLKALTRHCTLYARVGWFTLSPRRLKHWNILIYKCILGLLPSYLQTYIHQKSTGTYRLSFNELLLLSVPIACTELGKQASAWNKLQSRLNLKELVSLNEFKQVLNISESGMSVCHCCVWPILSPSSLLWSLKLVLFYLLLMLYIVPFKYLCIFYFDFVYCRVF